MGIGAPECVRGRCEGRRLRAMSEAPKAPKAGWYDDPDYAGTKRYWDGERWTEHREPPLPGTPPKPSAAARQISSLVQLIVIFAFVAVGLIILAELVG